MLVSGPFGCHLELSRTTEVDMKNLMRAAAFSLLVGWAAIGTAADEQATPEEVIVKVRDAAALIATEGEASLSLFEDARSDFVWKDSYVFVWDCAADKVVAHPVPANRGLTISTITDKAGKPIGKMMCAAAEKPHGSWVEYTWPQTAKDSGSEDLKYTGEPARKVTYMLSVDGQPYQVGAGIVEDTDTLEQLDALLTNPAPTNPLLRP
jgi:cytochrome c